ncbi:TIGR01777 family oxidoreductase [Flavobacterium seoulense]|uniref:Cell division protein n=1 Tax=Flavobacterium seoulense TaxID=1492738 RepID=A0A066WU31_9FLAO|nr:TIGR01777 family oxidoreductase [Flavobacterium seoulense]KDN56088.1 cell division protein [Flavobacterium seoulense]
MRKNVLITGGTGFVGRNLTQKLVDNGYSVSILSRSKKTNTENVFYYKWDVEKQFIEAEAIQKADYVIHLAGENIGEKRWTKKRKKAILLSRKLSAQLIFDVLQKSNSTIEAFISASAVGIYGAINGQAICRETTKPANDFLGLTCQKWEAATLPFEKLRIRTVKIRTGLVLGKNEGLLKKLSPVFKWRLGSALGSGKQYMPWIHIDDLCSIYLEAIKNPEMQGAYNAAVTDDTNNQVFSATLAKVYGYSIWLPNVPSFFIQFALGEMANLVLKGRRISNEKIKDLGFQFEHENLETAIKKCLF